jgi:hypothetical protein
MSAIVGPDFAIAILTVKMSVGLHDHTLDKSALTSVSSALVLGGWPKARCGARSSAHLFPSTVN